MQRLRHAWRWCLPGLRAAWLPVALAVLFALQNIAFDAWLNIAPDLYQRMALASLSLGLLLYGPAIFLRGRWRLAYLAAMATAVAVLLAGEYLYYSYSGSYFQVTAFRLLGQAGSFTGAAASRLSARLLLFAVGPAAVGLVWWRSRRRGARAWLAPVPPTGWLRAALAVLLIVGIGGGYGVLVVKERREYGDCSRLYLRLYDLDAVVGRMGIGNYFLEDAVKRAFFRERVTAADRTFVRAWQAARPPAAANGADFGLARGRNLILIQVESLEEAVIGAKVGGREVTPNLNALARAGLHFSRYYAPVGLGNTADAEFMTLNSLYAPVDRVAFIDNAHNRYAALPQLLVDHGYDTNVFHGDVATFWNRSSIYPGLGYQHWFMKDSFTITRPLGITGLGDRDLFEQTLVRLKTLPQPFMATVMTLTSHVPFLLPDDLRTLPVPDQSGLTDEDRHYLESVNYTDAALGDFISGLKAAGLYDNAVIAIFGDHGSYTSISADLGAGQDEMDKQRVPLILLVPGTGLAGERTTPSSHLDLYPTLAHLLGLAAPPSALGQDLLVASKPAVISRDPGTDALTAAIGSEVTFQAAADGLFEHGTCRMTATQTAVPVERCRAFVDEQTATLKASDLIIRGNLVGELRQP